MKSIFFTCFFLIFGAVLYAQTRVKTNRMDGYFYCPSSNEKAIECFEDALDGYQLSLSIHNYEYMGGISNRFYQAFQADTTFCDALFYAGSALSYTKDKVTAIAFLYMADSLCDNKSYVFKKTLADESFKTGVEPGIKLAQKKYSELIKFFPNDGEAYYSYSLASFTLEEYEEGILNIDKAIQIFRLTKEDKFKNDAYLLKGMLLASTGRYELALKAFEILDNDYNTLDSYKIFYCLSLLNVANVTGDEKMLKNARKVYKRINKELLTPDLKIAFDVFEKKE